MTYTTSKDLHYRYLREQNSCCDPVSGWEKVYDWAYWNYRRIFVGMFEWSMPEEYPKLYANPSRVEKILFDNGLALAWMKDDQLMITKCVRYGVDEYGEPDIFIPILYGNASNPTSSFSLTLDDCVPIWNNEDMLSTYASIEPWLVRYARSQAVMDNNLMYSNYPLLIKVKEGKDVEARYTGSILKDMQTMIVQDGSVNPLEDLEVINLNVPYLLDKLRYVRDGYGNDILQAGGINTVEQQKKERLITAEANSNAEKNTSISGVKLQLRQNACAQIKKMFGVDISVEKRELDLYLPRGDANDNRTIQSVGKSDSNLQ